MARLQTCFTQIRFGSSARFQKRKTNGRRVESLSLRKALSKNYRRRTLSRRRTATCTAHKCSRCSREGERRFFYGAPGGIRTPNPQIRSLIGLLLVFASPVFSVASPPLRYFLFIWFQPVFDQSGSKMVAEIRCYPQIYNLLSVKNAKRNNYLKIPATTMLPI
jgi:hypothetical protein